MLAWVAVVAMLMLVFALIYYFAPDVKKKCWQWLSPGAAIGIGGWVAASLRLRVYLHYFDSFSATYGSLGAVIVLLTWFYLTGLMLLAGAEINSEIQAAVAEKKLKEAGVIAGARGGGGGSEACGGEQPRVSAQRLSGHGLQDVVEVRGDAFDAMEVGVLFAAVVVEADGLVVAGVFDDELHGRVLPASAASWMAARRSCRREAAAVDREDVHAGGEACVVGEAVADDVCDVAVGGESAGRGRSACRARTKPIRSAVSSSWDLVV